ncbi:MAG TPA: glycosyltransferase [Pyrinomonadaceae bacterium]|nr:glycosyltransferase [Pyrinomonadaceae bacterium]
MRTLYICYLSLDEPLVQSQVLPYVREIAAGGIEVHLLTFEKELQTKSADQLAAARESLTAQGIDWSYLPYHKRPSMPATLYDVLRGALRIVRFARRHAIDVLHARAHIPMAMALIARRLTGCKTIFDLRGLVAEEYVDAGIWKKNSIPFKIIKWIERAGLSQSNQIVVLTNSMRDWLVHAEPTLANKISVIPTCVDRSRFNVPADRSNRFELVYAGSVVGLYLLADMARFFIELKKREPNAFFRILTQTPRATVAQVMQCAGVSPDDFEVVAVSPAEIPDNMTRARLGVSFRKPTFSQIAASPTKIGEYLAAGIPVVSNSGTGDIDELMESEHVGLTVSSFDDAMLAQAADQALTLARNSEVEMQCRDTAAKHFDLIEIGGKRYLEVYRRLESGHPCPQ